MHGFSFFTPSQRAVDITKTQQALYTPAHLQVRATHRPSQACSVRQRHAACLCLWLALEWGVTSFLLKEITSKLDGEESECFCLFRARFAHSSGSCLCQCRGTLVMMLSSAKWTLHCTRQCLRFTSNAQASTQPRPIFHACAGGSVAAA